MRLIFTFYLSGFISADRFKPSGHGYYPSCSNLWSDNLSLFTDDSFHMHLVRGWCFSPVSFTILQRCFIGFKSEKVRGFTFFFWFVFSHVGKSLTRFLRLFILNLVLLNISTLFESISSYAPCFIVAEHGSWMEHAASHLIKSNLFDLT